MNEQWKGRGDKRYDVGKGADAAKNGRKRVGQAKQGMKDEMDKAAVAQTNDGKNEKSGTGTGERTSECVKRTGHRR